MEAAKLSCIGSPLSLSQPRSSSSSSRGTSANRVLCSLKSSSSPTSSLSSDHPPSASTLSPQLSVLSVVGALANFVFLPALAAEQALESSLSSLSSSSAAEAASTQVSESAGASAIQSSVENAVQSSAEIAKAAAPQAVVADTGDGNLIVNILGTASFIGLSLLTIGVVYLAVTDFLEKRKTDEETKKLNEEMASAKKKQTGSLTAASRGGAKGFGKKQQEEE